MTSSSSPEFKITNQVAKNNTENLLRLFKLIFYDILSQIFLTSTKLIVLRVL